MHKCSSCTKAANCPGKRSQNPERVFPKGGKTQSSSLAVLPFSAAATAAAAAAFNATPN